MSEKGVVEENTGAVNERDGIESANDAVQEGISEAIQAAAHRVKPKRSVNGVVRGAGMSRITAKMRAFASLVASGESPREAYRKAYNVPDGREHRLVAGANALMRDKRIAGLMESVWEQVKENIVDDQVMARRYIMTQLREHAESAEGVGNKLRALELMGKAIGMFVEKIETKVEEVSPAQLKADLRKSLALLDSKPLRIVNIIDNLVESKV